MDKKHLLIGLLLLTLLSVYGQQADVFDQLQRNVWYLQTEDKTANLYLTHLGKGSDTIVCLHGGPGNNFNYLVDAVKDNAQEAFFLMYDQRGSLYSPVADSLVSRLTLDDLVEDLEAIRKATHQAKLTLFGHSFGSLLAISYYIKYPLHVDKIILTASMPPIISHERPFSTIVKEIHTRTRALRERPEVNEVLRREGLDDETGLSPQQLSDRFKIKGLASFNMVDLRNWRNFKGGRVYYNTKVDGAIANSIPEEYDIRSALEIHQVPITLIQGVEDYIDPAASYWKEIADHYPTVTIIPVEGSGHYIWLDKPKEFTEILKRTIRKNKTL